MAARNPFVAVADSVESEAAAAAVDEVVVVVAAVEAVADNEAAVAVAAVGADAGAVVAAAAVAVEGAAAFARPLQRNLFLWASQQLLALVHRLELAQELAAVVAVLPERATPDFWRAHPQPSRRNSFP